jgi:phosphohistidine swiveling domain-containing protein
MGQAASVVDLGPTGSWVLSLDHRDAARPELTGTKAASLATARCAGLPVRDGFVLTTEAIARWADDLPTRRALDDAWERLSDAGRLPVIVRSSSTVEDTRHSSMAGLFLSILSVRSRDELHDAVDRIVRHGADRSEAPLAVLVQPMVRARLGGVLFGADPLTGRDGRFVVAAVPRGPDVLVSGEAQGAHYVLGRHGRTIEVDGGLVEMGARERRALAALARRTRRLFGTHQDIEWAFDEHGSLWLLQSRPISTIAASTRGPEYGAGPIAETLPHRLAALETDLWVPALDEGLGRALDAAGGRRRSDAVVRSLDGWVVANLDAFAPEVGGIRRVIDPRVGARRLRTAWRTGRLRATLPDRAECLLRAVDADLAAVPPLPLLEDDELARVLVRGQGWLRSLHGHEALCGIASSRRRTSVETGAERALAALARGREDGLDDNAIVARDPVVLMLTVPRIGARGGLPLLPAPSSSTIATTSASKASDARDGPDHRLAHLREQLRERVRLVHELTARAAFELGERWAAADGLADPHAVRDVDLDELLAAVAERRAPQPRPSHPTVASVPARFVLDERGRPVPVLPRRRYRRRSMRDGTGAGGGRSTGVVVDRHDAAPGAVLVVATLDPELAPLLPGLAGLVAETGSVLSHLAILAREHGVATVVGVPDARRRWPPGTLVTVDGTAGAVSVADPAVSR